MERTDGRKLMAKGLLEAKSHLFFGYASFVHTADFWMSACHVVETNPSYQSRSYWHLSPERLVPNMQRDEGIDGKNACYIAEGQPPLSSQIQSM